MTITVAFDPARYAVSYPIKGTPYYDQVAPKPMQLEPCRAPFAAFLPTGRPVFRGRGGVRRLGGDLQRGGSLTPTAGFDPVAARYKPASTIMGTPNYHEVAPNRCLRSEPFAEAGPVATCSEVEA